MICPTIEGAIVRIPDDKLCAAIRDDTCIAWAIGDSCDEGELSFNVTRDVAVKIMQATGDQEVE